MTKILHYYQSAKRSWPSHNLDFYAKNHIKSTKLIIHVGLGLRHDSIETIDN